MKEKSHLDEDSEDEFLKKFKKSQQPSEKPEIDNSNQNNDQNEKVTKICLEKKSPKLTKSKNAKETSIVNTSLHIVTQWSNMMRKRVFLYVTLCCNILEPF